MQFDTTSWDEIVARNLLSHSGNQKTNKQEFKHNLMPYNEIIMLPKIHMVNERIKNQSNKQTN